MSFFAVVGAWPFGPSGSATEHAVLVCFADGERGVLDATALDQNTTTAQQHKARYGDGISNIGNIK